MKTALYISCVNIALNISLAIVKLTVGFVSGSDALVSDGVHSVADVFSSAVVYIGIRLSARVSDRKHPYGHERMECVAAVLLAIVVGATGIGIGASGLRSVMTVGFSQAVAPGRVALIVAVIGVIVKELMFRYSRFVAIRTKSDALLADAWHMRTDALSSVSGLVGVLGANLGIAILDPIAAVVISLMIVKAAVEIFTDAMRKMTDRSCDDAFEELLRECVCQHSGVCGLREMKTRLFGSRVFAEVTVEVEGSLSCKQAFEVARQIEYSVCEQFEEVKDCAVHIYPL